MKGGGEEWWWRVGARPSGKLADFTRRLLSAWWNNLKRTFFGKQSSNWQLSSYWATAEDCFYSAAQDRQTITLYLRQLTMYQHLIWMFEVEICVRWVERGLAEVLFTYLQSLHYNKTVKLSLYCWHSNRVVIFEYSPPTSRRCVQTRSGR